MSTISLFVIGIIVAAIFIVIVVGKSKKEKNKNEYHQKDENIEKPTVSNPLTVSYCPKCGTKLLLQDVFCTECGQKIDREFFETNR